MDNYKKISRNDFMNFFKDDDKINELTVDDRVEIFSSILSGCSDFTKELLENILFDYNVKTIEIIETNYGKKK